MDKARGLNEAHGWGTFIKCKARWDYCLVLGPFTFGNFPTLRLFTRHEKSCGPQPFQIKLFAGSTNRDILIDKFLTSNLVCVYMWRWVTIGIRHNNFVFSHPPQIVPCLTLVHKTRCPQPLFVWHLYTKHDVHHSLFDTCTQNTMSTTL